MSCLVHQLPPEIVLQILQHVRQLSALDGSHASIVPSLQCCTRWYELGRQVLYGRTVLKTCSLVRFVKRFSQDSADNRQTLALITSLTISVSVGEPQASYDSTSSEDDGSAGENEESFKEEGERQLRAPLTRLCMILPRMSHLTTFSLSADAFSIPSWTQDEVPGHLLSSILTHLPSSCVNLELDLHKDENDETHSCPAIAGLLPRLDHLRLRMQCMCPALFGAATASQHLVYPSLRTCIVNCNTLFGKAIPCNAPTRQKKKSPHSFPAASDLLIKTLEDLYLQKRLPRIKHLNIITGESVESSYDWYLTGFYSQIDVLQSKTWTVSYEIGIGSILQRLPGFTIQVPGGELRNLHASDVFAFLEGSAWLRTIVGSRFPSAALSPDERADCMPEWVFYRHSDISEQ